MEALTGLLCWLFFLFAALVVLLAAVIVLHGRYANLWLRIMYYVWFISATVGAYATTFWCEYYPNPNTRFCGWPVPRVVFQRADAASPWKDYICSSIVFAYPMNFLLYILPPSIVVLLLALRRGGRNRAGQGGGVARGVITENLEHRTSNAEHRTSKD